MNNTYIGQEIWRLGMYKGKKLCQLDKSYLRWVMREFEPTNKYRLLAGAELERRRELNGIFSRKPKDDWKCKEKIRHRSREERIAEEQRMIEYSRLNIPWTRDMLSDD